MQLYFYVNMNGYKFWSSVCGLSSVLLLTSFKNCSIVGV